jgi:lipopolysaccharide export system ATP-binding protein
MTTPSQPTRIQELVDRLAKGDRSAALALHALICAADRTGTATFNDVAVQYRNDHLAALRAAGADAEREAGRLSMDEVRENLATSVMPRLASERVVVLPPGGLHAPDAHIRVVDRVWQEIGGVRSELADMLKQTGEHVAIRAPRPSVETSRIGKGSTLEARGLVKRYRRRSVVNDVALRLQQGEIVGLLGPNGAGKTTTF